jgi:hypothetical protein
MENTTLGRIKCQNGAHKIDIWKMQTALDCIHQESNYFIKRFASFVYNTGVLISP